MILFDDAYKLVRDYRYLDPKTKLPNKFPFEYSTHQHQGIYRKLWRKDIKSVKPSTLEYILYNLHDVDEVMIYETLIAYLYYWKVRKKDFKTMIKKFKEVKSHYEVLHTLKIPQIDSKPSVYYISFYIGNIKLYKIGYSDNPTERFKQLFKDIKANYPLVSIGELEIIDIQSYSTKREALRMEQKILDKYKQDNHKFLFNGHTEVYLDALH